MCNFVELHLVQIKDCVPTEGVRIVDVLQIFFVVRSSFHEINRNNGVVELRMF